MKSILRINGTETVVEGVIPTSDDFNRAVYEAIQHIAKGMVEFEVDAPFGVPPEKVESYVNYTLGGKFDGELPVKIRVFDVEAGTTTNLTGFIVFRK